MALLIIHLADDPNFEVHVFGPEDNRSGNPGEEVMAGGDPVVNAVQAGVHHWHQVQDHLCEVLSVCRMERSIPQLTRKASLWCADTSHARFAPVAEQVRNGLPLP